MTTTPFTSIPSNAGRPKSGFLLAIEALPVDHKCEVQLEDADGIKTLRAIVFKHCRKSGKVIKSRKVGGNNWAFYRVS
jgi:hypothetical protein